MEENYMHICELTLLWTAKQPFCRAEGPLFKTFLFIKIEG